MARDTWLIPVLCEKRWGFPPAAQLLGVLVLFSRLGFAAISQPATAEPTPAVTRWHMLNVSPNQEQADCHLIVLPDGRNVLIDIADAADAPGAALAAFKAANVTILDLVVVSHFHSDHYGRLLDLIDAGVQIKRGAVNIPDEATARKEEPWGCRYEDVMATLAGLKKRGVPYFNPSAGDCLMETVIDGRSIDDEQRIARALNGVESANANGRRGARRSRLGRHHNARRLSRERVYHVRLVGAPNQ